MRRIEFSNELARAYAKKIMGFAYSKTHNVQIAEDLSQEILLALSKALTRQEQIADLDGFVYTVCCYTWSGFFRKNKKHWDNLPIDAFYDLCSESDPETETARKLLIEKLQTEIAYLAKLHRKITLLYYYENKKGDEIAQMLHIPHTTVRWHLGQIKKKLKEGLKVTNDNLNYTPRRIMAGIDGTIMSGNQCGLGKDRVVDNICLACYGKPLTIEEISRKLMIAAAYIEGHIENLVYMDYLKVVDKNKYITNFFIETLRHEVLQGKFHLENIGGYAKKIYTAFEKRYDRIKAIGFLGSRLDKDFMLWALMPLAVNALYYSAKSAVFKKNKIVIDTPIRKDGSQYWVCATLCDDQYFETQTEFTAAEIDFTHKSRGNGIKSCDDGLNNAALLLDSRATIDAGIPWRNFDIPNLEDLSRIANIIRSGETPNEFDKLAIVREAEQGYVKMDGERPVMLIPYFSKSEYDQFNSILEEIIAEVSPELFVPYIEEYAKQFEKELPDFLSKEEKIYHKYSIYPQYAVLYWLSDHGFLRYPDQEEAKRLCIVVWELK